MIQSPLASEKPLAEFSDYEILEFERELCRKDLRYLCREVLRFTHWDTCHDDLYGWLSRSRSNRKLILMPRGHLKTSIITVGLAIQHILNDFNTSILLANAVWDNARSFLAEIKEYLTTKSTLPILFHTFSRVAKWNEDEIIIHQRRKPNKTPTVSTAGVEKALASQHYKVIFADDIVNRQSISTQDQREKTYKFYSDLLDLLEPDGTLYVVGTRWHDGDLYGHLLRTEKDRFDVYIRKARENGQVIFPKKYNDKVLDDLKISKGSYEFNAQYMNDPGNPEDQQFKPPTRYWAEVVEGSVHTGTVDLAISEKTSADYSVVMDCARTRSDQMLVVDYCRKRMNPTEVIEKIFDFAQKYKWRKLGVESVAYQRAMVHLLEEEQKKRKLYFEIVPIYHQKDKFTRIMGLQPIWESGNLLLKQGMIELEEEIARFPIGEHDDVLDALAMQLEVSESNANTGRVYVPERFKSYGQREYERVF